MTLPNLLESRRGRLTAFFGLYVSEGLPQGFTGVAVALEFKRMGMEGKAIAAFAATIMLPWAWKWMVGPLVDRVKLSQHGHRKPWIVLSQVGMWVSLVAALWMFPTASTGADGVREITGLALFSGILLLHNIFAAAQDVAIDSLACLTLPEEERGVANGLMFAGAQAGAALGGSGVLFLKEWLGFTQAACVVPLMLLCVLSGVIVLLTEPKNTQGELAEEVETDASGVPLATMWDYLREVMRAFFLTKRGLLGLVLALLPFGGMALSLVVSTVITPTLGMTDAEIARMGVVSSVVFIVFCMSGGFLSDRFGRLRVLALAVMGTVMPTLWIGWRLHAEGWDFPGVGNPDGTWPRHEALIVCWWWAGMVHSVFFGMLYGIRTALFMDLVEPRIAATQFTAYMALLNVVTIYCYAWQGNAITSVAKGGWGLSYVWIFGIDALLGMACLAVFPFLMKKKSKASAPVQRTYAEEL